VSSSNKSTSNIDKSSRSGGLNGTSGKDDTDTSGNSGLLAPGGYDTSHGPSLKLADGSAPAPNESAHGAVSPVSSSNPVRTLFVDRQSETKRHRQKSSVKSLGGGSVSDSTFGDQVAMLSSSGSISRMLATGASTPKLVGGKTAAEVKASVIEQKHDRDYAPLTEEERLAYVRKIGREIMVRRIQLPEITQTWLYSDEELVEEAYLFLKENEWRPPPTARSQVARFG